MLNPLIVAVIVGLLFSYFKIIIPPVINSTVGFLSELALPLALVGIGGSLNLQNIKRAQGSAFTSSAIKRNSGSINIDFGCILFWIQRN